MYYLYIGRVYVQVSEPSTFTHQQKNESTYLIAITFHCLFTILESRHLKIKKRFETIVKIDFVKIECVLFKTLCYFDRFLSLRFIFLETSI